ncbi:hypothetical protein ACFLZC_01840 [Patescibacteria group bacterium]
MIQIVRKKKESTLSLLKRFSRKTKQSGNLVRFKNTQFKKRPKSALTKKRDALKKIKKKEEINKLYKLGKVDYKAK